MHKVCVRHGPNALVICTYRRDCELMSSELCKAGLSALCYHAGLSDEERVTAQQRWVQEDRCKVRTSSQDLASEPS